MEEETKLGLKLNTPAGHLEPGETPAQGCAREVLEEAAYDFTPTAFLGLYLARSRKNPPAKTRPTCAWLSAASWAGITKAVRWTTASCARCG